MELLACYYYYNHFTAPWTLSGTTRVSQELMVWGDDPSSLFPLLFLPCPPQIQLGDLGERLQVPAADPGRARLPNVFFYHFEL